MNTALTYRDAGASWTYRCTQPRFGEVDPKETTEQRLAFTKAKTHVFIPYPQLAVK